MPSPTDALLQQILATDQARVWLEQLTAAFFDPDAKRAVLDAIRAGLPALVQDLAAEALRAPTPPVLDPIRAGLPALGQDLDAEALRSLTARVFQEQCREASRRAQRPEPTPVPDFTPLTGPGLGEQIVARYPYPIALAYHAL